MLDYYAGNHDILRNYRYEANRSNEKTVINYIHKFVEEEISYTLGNPITYISNTGNERELKDINYQLFHWSTTHNQELCRQLEIFGKAYELYYVNQNGEFCGRILNPTDAIAYTDSDGIPQLFIHFYKKQYDTAQYYDIYYPDHRIEIYKDNSLVETKSHIFTGVPVSICEMDINQTIFNKIKTLNDNLNRIISDQVNVISDYRNAYLVVTGVEVDEQTALDLKSKGLLNLKGKDSDVHWLMKEMNSEYIESMIKEIKDNMYSICNHIDGNEKLQSNTSGVALRSRLVFLEQRCKTIFDTISDTISDRIRFLYQYLSLKNTNYDYKDIILTYSPCVPQDLTSIAQVITQLGDIISHETALSLLPFVENPVIELEKIKKEQSEQQSIDLDKVGLIDE